MKVSRFTTLLMVAVPLALTACTTARPMMAPSGAQGLKIWCEMPSQCYERAAKECPSGYSIEANEKDYWGLGDIDGNLFIVCKAPGQQAQPVAVGARVMPNGSTPLAPPAPADNCEACERIGNP